MSAREDISGSFEAGDISGLFCGNGVLAQQTGEDGQAGEDHDGRDHAEYYRITVVRDQPFVPQPFANQRGDGGQQAVEIESRPIQEVAAQGEAHEQHRAEHDGVDAQGHVGEIQEGKDAQGEGQQVEGKHNGGEAFDFGFAHWAELGAADARPDEIIARPADEKPDQAPEGQKDDRAPEIAQMRAEVGGDDEYEEKAAQIDVDQPVVRGGPEDLEFGFA